ncbi:MAG: hypothetical protein K2R98_27605 [Gemmataceae bacterium]|nr:hypothetical protein [Gemmataceae bacterium]
MKRNRLPLVTFFAIVLTSTVLAWNGGMSPNRLCSTRQASSQPHDPLSSQAGWRWKQCQARHWRSCMLQQ